VLRPIDPSRGLATLARGCESADYHLRRTALPPPGGEEQLRKLVGRVTSQKLDRTKPLWEMWIAEGLEDGH
jgi:hypothetical protein